MEARYSDTRGHDAVGLEHVQHFVELLEQTKRRQHNDNNNYMQSSADSAHTHVLKRKSTMF